MDRSAPRESPSDGPLGILVALREEYRAIEPLLQQRRHRRNGSLRYVEAILRGQPVVLTRTGIGKTTAERKTTDFLRLVSPRCLIATGFAGGLRDDVRCGDVILAEDVTEAPPLTFPLTNPLEPVGRWRAATALLAAADTLPSTDTQRVYRGRLLTVEDVLAKPEQKQAAGGTFSAAAVDMESSAVARVAEASGIPTLCARAVLDEVQDPLPFDFGKILTPEGRVRPLRALVAVASRPTSLREVDALRRRARRAAASITAFLPDLIDAMTQR